MRAEQGWTVWRVFVSSVLLVLALVRVPPLVYGYWLVSPAHRAEITRKTLPGHEPVGEMARVGGPERAFPRTGRWPRTFGVPLSSRTMRTRRLQRQWLADAYPQGAATSGSCNAAGRSAMVSAMGTGLRWHRHSQFSRCMQS